MELLFEEKDILEHVVSGEKCVVAKILEQEMPIPGQKLEEGEEPEMEKVSFYVLSAELAQSNMVPVDTAHGSLKKVL